MNIESKKKILSESPLFDNLLALELTTLAELFAVCVFENEEIVFNAGDVGDSMFILAEGTVEILVTNALGDCHRITELHAPTFFGEMSLIDKEDRTATVRVKGIVKLLQLSSENLHVFAKTYRNGFTWVLVNIARELSSRLRETNRRLIEKI